MQLSLIRRSSQAEAGFLDTVTGRIDVQAWGQGREAAPLAFVPEIPAHGFYDTLGGLSVAVYRSPGAPEILWLQLGPSRFAFGDDLRSIFSPALSPGDAATGDGLRTFHLFEHGKRVALCSYRLGDQKRRSPGAPEEDEGGDLLYFAHRVLADRAWDRVLTGGRKEARR